MFANVDNNTVFLFLAFVIGALLIILLASSARSQSSHAKKWLNASKGEMVEEKQPRSISELALGAITTSQDDIETKFLRAGIYNTRFASFYMPVKYVVLFSGFSAIYFFKGYISEEVSVLIAILSFWSILVIIAPDSYLNHRAKTYKQNISDQLPYLIDLLAVCVQTGMTIEAAFNYLSKELTSFNKDLGYLMNKTNDRTKIVGLEQALQELHKRVPTSEMRSFVMTINQSLQYGSSIYNVLTTLAADIREVQLLRIEEGVGKLSAKMSVPLILFIMFPIVVLVAVPGVMRALNG